MKFDADRLQATTSLFGPDGAHRYWWRSDFEAGGFKGDQLERVLWVFMCPDEGPTKPAHLSTIQAWTRQLGGRNIGVVSLFNVMGPLGDVMRNSDPAGPHADAALRAALAWVRHRDRKVLPSGRVMLCTGKPPWTFAGHVQLVEDRNAYLWTQLRKRTMRASTLGNPVDGWPPNPLDKAMPVASVTANLRMALPNDGGPLPDLEPTPVGWVRP
ncbi:hypothetical protein W2_gp029c [Caulobacter phage W2]|uniref:Uncharacterized protein n=1 Tax=Caulobacter phage TMCBR4 TaxID=3028191 RepID=A0AAE9ZNK0_9CAUD|nr:hypothetical protein TMCBR4_gp030c [Caulobacter phage TMCBR4]WDS38397.1 hypothetical protein W2_gp029c [Caulobacter phage W2]